MASAGELLKFSLQGASHRAGLSIADGAEVDLPQAHDFGSRSADKHFVGDINWSREIGSSTTVCSLPPA